MLQIPITTNAAEILRTLQGMPDAMAQAIAQAMDLENQLTIGVVQANHLTGPRPAKLGVRTNRLRSSINASPAKVNASVISSVIGTNVKYAAAHEFGVDQDVQVKAHTRKNAQASSAKKTFDMKTGRITGRGAIGNAVVHVRAFKRHMTMPKRSFLAPAITERADNYGKAVSAAILGAWQGGAA